MDQYIGKMLDNRYEILERIGTGGMAVVYKARCHRLNRLVAVKILKPELASDAEFRRRFHDESQAVAMLSHINIVGVYDVSRSDDLDYIVMELIDGLTLKQYMQKRGAPLNWREALHFITQIVRALGHAHSRGIIHRDIKPQNILVLRDGSVKVTDFGIARVASAAQATLTQEALGSVHYISPEQARGSHIDGRSDLYSAGVVLYEMLTGRLPFEGETPVSVAIQHINSIPIPPRDLNPDIPPALEAITLKAMAPKVENRYASAEDMLSDLEEFRKNPNMMPSSINVIEPLVADEPTRVVPVTDIQQEEQRQRRSRRTERGDGREKAPQELFDDGSDYDEDEPKKGVPPILWAILAILIFVGGMAFFVYNFFFKGMITPAQEYEVPKVTNFTIEQLEETPSLYDGFTLVVGETVNNDEYPEGTVIEQSPEAGTTVKEGSDMIITVTVSAGEEVIYMPNVVNQEFRQVTSDLREQGLNVEIEQEYDDDIISGNIIRSDPVEGTKLSQGDTVTLVVSQGKEKSTVTVVSFINMDINRARSTAEMLGLTVGEVKEFYSDEYDAGKVMFQSITANSVVDKGTVINFQVSLGPEPTPSEEPSVAPSEEVSEPQPSSSATPVTATKVIRVDLTNYDKPVTLRVVVGGTVFHEGSVSYDTFEVSVTGSGEKDVEIYVDDALVDSYTIDFDS
jgi:serine/threonine-protein kinase